jgi:hypothetical protein
VNFPGPGSLDLQGSDGISTVFTELWITPAFLDPSGLRELPVEKKFFSSHFPQSIPVVIEVL